MAFMSLYGAWYTALLIGVQDLCNNGMSPLDPYWYRSHLDQDNFNQCLHFLFQEALGAHPGLASPEQRHSKALAPAQGTGSSGLCRQGSRCQERYVFVAECGQGHSIRFPSVPSLSIGACPHHDECGGYPHGLSPVAQPHC